MRMKKFNLMWQGLILSALALGFASCEPTDTPCPNKNEADGNTDQGVTVVLEMEDIDTGEVSTNTLRAGSNRFTVYGNDGDVQVKNTGFKPKPPETDDIQVDLTYFAKEDIVFQGWSWRYYEDPKSTHRGHTEEKIEDFLPTVALQTEPGLQKLALSKAQTNFVCKYKVNTQNKVLVKVRYEKKKALKFPPMIPLEKIPLDFFKYISMLKRIPLDQVAGVFDRNTNVYTKQSELYLWYFIGRPLPHKLNEKNLPLPTELQTITNPVNNKIYSVPLHYYAKLSYYDCFLKLGVEDAKANLENLKAHRKQLERESYFDKSKKAALEKLNNLIEETETAFAEIDPIVQMWEDFPPHSFEAADPKAPK